MNIRSTTPVLKQFATSSSIVAIAVTLTITSVFPLNNVYADEYDDRIRQIERQVGQYQSQAAVLNKKSNSLQAAVDGLSAQVNAIQSKINLSQAKYDKLVQQIKDTEIKITKNQGVLGETLGSLYVNAKISPVEMLASSKNVGDYLDQQEYRSSVRDQVESSIKEIKKLKRELEKQEVSAKNILDEQKGQRSDLEVKKKEQSTLLAQTRGSEEAYRGMVASSLGEIQKQRDAQNAAYAAARAAWGGGYVTAGGSGGYPYAGTGLTLGGCGNCIDEFSLYMGQCTSYVAWRLASEGKKVYKFDGLGHASQWPSTTTSYWGSKYGVGNAARQQSTPKAGYAAIDPTAAYDPYEGIYYGHVMYIEGVNEHNGTIRISEYNFQSPDTYSVRDNVPTSGLIFLEFASQ